MSISPFVLGQQNWTLNTTSGRAVREIVRELQGRFGWVISYEEGIYDANHLRPDGPGSFVPSAPRMSFVAAASLMANGRTMSGEQRAAAVRGLLKQFARQSDLRFKITPDGSYVMPSVQAPQNRVLPNAGDAYRSPLDVTVKLRPAETYPNLASAIQDVIAQVASASGLSIGVGMMPFNVVLNRKLWFDVPDNISAREALAKILHQINADPSAFSAPPDQLAWELNYDPASRGFFFNVVIVPDSAPPRQVSDPAGGVGPTKDRLGQGR